MNLNTIPSSLITKELSSRWEYAGSELYSSMVPSYYRGCHGAGTFDLTMKGWKDDLIHRLREVRENTTQNPNLSVVMFGNKNDLEEERVGAQEGS